MIGNKEVKFRVHLPYECLFDLRWGFIRKYSGLSDIELLTRFNGYCSRLTDDLTTIVPSLTKSFTVTPDVVKLSPRTAVLTIITNIFRQFISEHPDDKVTLHLTINFDKVEFIPNSTRQNIIDMLKLSMEGIEGKIHAKHIAESYKDTTIKKLRKQYNCLVVYSIQDMITHFNTSTPNSYQGLGIITRPLFLNGKSPEEFHKLVNSVDKRNGQSGNILNPGDHYDILSDAFSHIGPIYFHEPQYFSAILPK